MNNHVKLFEEFTFADEYHVEVQGTTKLPDGIYDGEMIGHNLTIKNETFKTITGFRTSKSVDVKCKISKGTIKCKPNYK